MDFNTDSLLKNIKEELSHEFGEKLMFFGLQGSYARHEETDKSDIDFVIILTELTFEDIKNYKKIIEKYPFKEKFCGFLSGIKELQNWSKQDIFQFYYGTKSILGKLEDIIEQPSIYDIKLSMKTSAENLYHSGVHSYLYAANPKENLASLYKTTFFILQAKYFLKNNIYIATQKELLQVVQDADKEILNICINKNSIKNKNENDIERLYSKLIQWSKKLIIES